MAQQVWVRLQLEPWAPDSRAGARSTQKKVGLLPLPTPQHTNTHTHNSFSLRLLGKVALETWCFSS